MKKFQIKRYLKRFAVIIVLFAVLGTAVFYRYESGRQSYSATAVISYTNEDAKEGLAPDLSEIDVKEISSAKVVDMVFQELGLSYTDYYVGNLRSRIQIDPVTSTQSELIEESLNKEGEEYTRKPTEYVITFTANHDEGEEFARDFLNTLVAQYTLYYSENHVSQSASGNNLSEIYTKNYDYIEMMEKIDEVTKTTMESISGRAAADEQFRSVESGYSFYDLYYRFDLIRKNVLSDIFAEILNKKITKDQDILLSKYNNRISEYGLENIKNNDESEEIWNIIESYVNMMKESDNTNITYEYILDEVYDTYNNSDSQDTENTDKSSTADIDRTVEYDQLIYDYVEDRTSYEYAVIDTAYCTYINSLFSGEVASDEESQLYIQERIQSLVEELNELYSLLAVTNAEYNSYLGAKNINILSSVGVQENINLKFYMLVAFIALLLAASIAAIIFGRTGDIVDYYMNMDRHLGIPNRAKCDSFLEDKEKHILPVDYYCGVIRVANLGSLNEQYGRAEGDKILKYFADLAQEIFLMGDDSFVGYNGSGIFMIMGRCGNKDVLNQKKTFFELAVIEKNKEQKAEILYQIGTAVAGEEKIFDIRKLNSRAFTSVGKEVYGSVQKKEEANG
ncbi:MAG: diguanylate cyclase [Eubacteriales bacterium]|nr:diguanylate cyclase [Eubacteriales bacterium]